MDKPLTGNKHNQQLQLIAKHQDEPVTESFLKQLGMSRATYFRRLAEVRKRASMPGDVKTGMQPISPMEKLAVLMTERQEVRKQLEALGVTPDD